MSTLCHTCLGSFLIKQISVVKLQFLPLLQRPVLAFLAHRLSSGCGVRASHCGVFLWLRSSGSGAFGLQWLWHVGSAVRFPGSGARAQSLWHVGSAVQFAGSGARAQSVWHVGSAVRFPGSGAFGLQWLWHVGSAARFPGSGARSLGHWGCSGCGLWAQSLWQWALLDRGLWGLPRSGIEPMSPVLTGRFLTTETGFSAF